MDEIIKIKMTSRVQFIRLLHSCRPFLRTRKPADKPYRKELAKITPLSQWGKAPLQEGCSEWYYNRNPRSLELLGAVEKPKGFHRQRKRVGRIDYHRLYIPMRLLSQVSNYQVFYDQYKIKEDLYEWNK